MSEESTLIEDPSAAIPPATEPAAAAKPAQPLVNILAFAMIALVGALLALSLRNFMGHGVARADSPELLQLQAEANVLRSQLNNERVAIGLRPLVADSEPVDQLAARMKKDMDTVVALAGSFQRLIDEKDRDLSAKSAELLRAEAERQRLEGELGRVRATAASAGDLPAELAKLQAQRDGLAAELETARRELTAKAQGASAEDFANLQRRLEETQRAKEFFEAKVKELEPVPNS